ncbi:hypothetical protein [Helicobacter sp. T3_23-1056]
MTSVFECRKCRNKIEKEIYFEYGSDIPLPYDFSCYICGSHNFLENTTHKDDSNTKDNITPEQAKQNTLLALNAKSIPTPPPPTQITSSIKVLQEIKSLQRYLATIK